MKKVKKKQTKNSFLLLRMKHNHYQRRLRLYSFFDVFVKLEMMGKDSEKRNGELCDLYSFVYFYSRKMKINSQF